MDIYLVQSNEQHGSLVKNIRSLDAHLRNVHHFFLSIHFIKVYLHICLSCVNSCPLKLLDGYKMNIKLLVFGILK